VITTEDAARFWGRVDQSGGPDACGPLIVQQRIGSFGTVRMLTIASTVHLGAQSMTGHQAAYLLTYGTRAALIRHRCANNGCCNPAHLRAGTQHENMLDRHARRRAGIRPGELFTYEDEAKP